jgi:hypothetical protein
MNLMVSAVPGARGNIEFVAHVRRGTQDASIDAERLDAVIDDAAATSGR